MSLTFKILTMDSKEKEQEIEKNLEEINYASSEDIYNKEKHISLDDNGNEVINSENQESMSMDLDVPGSDLDNAQEKIGSEDEENNYYSRSDNNDNHEERNEDLIS